MMENEVKLLSIYLGAVTISWYSRVVDGRKSNLETVRGIEQLIECGCTINIHCPTIYGNPKKLFCNKLEFTHEAPPDTEK